jgi:hypothetical protein
MRRHASPLARYNWAICGSTRSARLQEYRQMDKLPTKMNTLTGVAKPAGPIRARGRSMVLGPHVRGRITPLVRRICALCPAGVVDDG